MTKPSAVAGPGVRVPPPVLFVAAVLVAWGLERIAPLQFVAGHAPHGVMRIAGVLAVASGLAFAAWGGFTFRRARTTVRPDRPASRLVSDGPYRWSRNPMYTGLAVVLVGLGLLLNSVWPVLLTPVVLVLLYLLVVRREERYLAAAFGDAYLDYRRRVRRWL